MRHGWILFSAACLMLWSGPSGVEAQPSAAEGGAAAERPSIPLPPPRPAEPQAQSVAQPPASGEVRDVPLEEAAAACPARLAAMEVRFERRPDLQEGSCGASQLVVVSGLPKGIELSPPATMTCPFAEALARWTRDHVVPQARQHLQATPDTMLIGTSYQCRDQRTGGKRSEHAFANAVDVMGFTFPERPPVDVSKQPEASPEARFQAAIRLAACTDFTTVLGPGSDEDHADHLHLDRRERKNDFRICN